MRNKSLIHTKDVKTQEKTETDISRAVASMDTHLVVNVLIMFLFLFNLIVESVISLPAGLSDLF